MGSAIVHFTLLFFYLASTSSAYDVFVPVISPEAKQWKVQAIRKLWDERAKMGHTPLEPLTVDGVPMTQFFIKNETASPSGSLKHRFVWMLMLWSVTEGKVTSNTTVFDSTSGNTGASEAYMCALLGLPFVAVVSKDLEEAKIKQITQYGGQILKVDSSERNAVAARMAEERQGFFINQFGNADAAEEFSESGNWPFESVNVFHEIDVRLRFELKHPHPHYFVHAAGTGGTISSVGKYINRNLMRTKVVLADSEHSLFREYVRSNAYTNLSSGDPGRPEWVKPGIPGIGYGYNAEPIIFGKSTSLDPNVIDEVASMPDMATVAAMRSMRDFDIDAGVSTALNFLVALSKAIAHKEGTLLTPNTERLSIVFIWGDPGSYYTSSYLNDSWVDEAMSGAGGMRALICWKKRIDEAILKGDDFMNAEKECAD